MGKVLHGDALQVLKTLPDCKFHTCITSPPYYNLRDYSAGLYEIGHEATPEQYIERLVDVFAEVRRVLREDGTLWLIIADSYAVKSGKQPPTNTRNSYGHTAKRVPVGLKEKDLIGIPWMLAFALREAGWYLRQDIIWQKSNCMPESVKDRCTSSYEHIFLLSKSPKYYFNAEAISEPIAESSAKRYAQDIKTQRGSLRQPGKAAPMKAALPRFGGQKYGEDHSQESRTKSGNVYTPSGRRNKRDVWTISTAHFTGAHFATFPPKLVETCLLAGCPIDGITLDPFAGSGTTGIVSASCGRDFLGIELNAEYVEMANKRILEAEMQGFQTQLI